MRTGLVFLALAVACARPSVVMQPNVQAALSGQKLFRQHCESCHGPQATGTGLAPALGRISMDDAALFRFVTNGDLRRGMPSWSRLPDQRRWQIVAYIRTLKNER